MTAFDKNGVFLTMGVEPYDSVLLLPSTELPPKIAGLKTIVLSYDICQLAAMVACRS